MNKNQVEGKVKDVAGKVQRKLGAATGSVSQQVKGAVKQVEGKIQKSIGDAEEESIKEQQAKPRPKSR